MVSAVLSPCYQRTLISPENFTFYTEAGKQRSKALSTDAKIYIYTAVKNAAPVGYYLDPKDNHSEKAIARSYQQVVMAGCVEIDTTHGLNGLFINDCQDTMGLEPYKIVEDLESPKYRRHPVVLQEEARKKADMLDTFFRTDWPSYLKLLETQANH